MQRAEFDSNPAAFRSSYASKQKELTDKLVAARKLLPDVSVSLFCSWMC
jgi:Mg-chelatase subunit ChlI